ncbi:hypothetical protein ACP70R_044808 [Stipagrostis hirtigluma subsp. patula]
MAGSWRWLLRRVSLVFSVIVAVAGVLAVVDARRNFEGRNKIELLPLPILLGSDLWSALQFAHLTPTSPAAPLTSLPNPPPNTTRRLNPSPPISSVVDAFSTTVEVVRPPYCRPRGCCSPRAGASSPAAAAARPDSIQAGLGPVAAAACHLSSDAELRHAVAANGSAPASDVGSQGVSDNSGEFPSVHFIYRIYMATWGAQILTETLLRQVSSVLIDKAPTHASLWLEDQQRVDHVLGSFMVCLILYSHPSVLRLSPVIRPRYSRLNTQPPLPECTREALGYLRCCYLETGLTAGYHRDYPPLRKVISSHLADAGSNLESYGREAHLHRRTPSLLELRDCNKALNCKPACEIPHCSLYCHIVHRPHMLQSECLLHPPHQPKKCPLKIRSVKEHQRLSNLNKGFKKNTCFDKNCLVCSMEPPTLSPRVIRSLGEAFCKVAPGVLTDDALTAKKPAKKQVGPEQAQSSKGGKADKVNPGKKNGVNDDKTKKKSKK